MRPLRAALALSISLLLHASSASAQSIQVTPLIRDDRVLVSFRFADAFTEEVREAVHSGLTITFVYEVDLRRSASLWIDRTLSSSRVVATVKYDPVARKYLVTRRENGRMEKPAIVDREEMVREWLTEFEKLPLFSSDTLETNAEYYVRVRAHTSPRNAAFVWPWGGDIAGLAKFTFLK
jgi:hypothetical protein